MKHLRTLRTSFVHTGIMLLVLLVLPLVALAETCTTDGSLCNPLNAQFSSIPSFIAGALRVLVIIALPIITLFIVISGFMFVFARGNQEQLSTARRNFFYVIIGALLVLGAWMLATLIGGTVTQLVGT